MSKFFCYSNSLKNITFLLGKLKTEFTSPIAKSTSPGLSDSTFFAHCGSLHFLSGLQFPLLCNYYYKLVLSSHNPCKNILIIVLKPKFLRNILPWVEGPHAWLQLCEVSLRKPKEKENHETFLAKFLAILRHGPKYTWLYHVLFIDALCLNYA